MYLFYIMGMIMGLNRIKCKTCGKYEMREKEIGMKKLNISDDIEIPIFHYWKWCKLNNNWCRNIAGNCGQIIQKPEKEIAGEINEVL